MLYIYIQHQRNRLCVNQSTLCLSHSPLLFPIYIYIYNNNSKNRKATNEYCTVLYCIVYFQKDK